MARAPKHTLANLRKGPPAPKGNQHAATHGAFGRSPEEQAEQLIEPIFQANPHLDRVRNGPQVARYAELLARIDHVHKWLATRADPVFSNRRTGAAHRIYNWLGQWERTASQEEDRLAISPLTRAKLGLDTAKAFDLAAHWASEEDDQDHDDEEHPRSDADPHGLPPSQVARTPAKGRSHREDGDDA